MLQSKLCHGDFSDCSFHVLDLVRSRLHSAVPNNVQALLAAEFAVADELLKQDEAA
jgi:hypothetical protein